MSQTLVTLCLLLVVIVQVPASGYQDPTLDTQKVVAPAAKKIAPADQDAPKLRRPERVVAPRAQTRPVLRPQRLRVDQADVPPKLALPDPTGKPKLQAKPKVAVRPYQQKEERQTAIFILKYTSASEVSQTILQWAATADKTGGKQPVAVATMASNNWLLVTGAPKELTSVRALVNELDQPSPQIRVKMAIVELSLNGESKPIPLGLADIEKILAELKERDDLRVVARPELVAQDSQPAFFNLAARVPRIVGSSVSPRGQTNSVELDNVGTALGVTARVVDKETVTLEVDLEHSYVGPKDEGTPVATSDTGVVIRTPQMPSITLQTTVTLSTGKAVTLAGMVQNSDRLWRKTVVLLQCDVLQ